MPAVTLCQMVSGPVGISGFEEGEFEGDSPTEEVAAQICLRGTRPVQLRAQEIDEAAKIRTITGNPTGHRARLAVSCRASCAVRSRRKLSSRSAPVRSLARYGLAGVSGTTAGTPSGLMLKARKVNGSLPGLPHRWTRPKGS